MSKSDKMKPARDDVNNIHTYEDDSDNGSVNSMGETTYEDSKDRSSDDGIQLAKSETRVVNMLRALVILVLILATAGASFAVYRFTRNEEQERFQLAFHGHSSKVIDVSKSKCT